MIRYHKLGYIALNVSDLKVSTAFYQNIVGLQLVSEFKNVATFLRCSRDHHNIILYPGKEPGLKRVGLEVEDPEQLEIAFEHLKKHGFNPQEVDEEERQFLAQGRSFRFRDPNSGILFEMYSDITQMAVPFTPTLTQIQRVGHLVIKVADFEKSVAHFKDAMNFKASDYVGENFVFMRFFPNPYHHSLGVARSDVRQLHHVNFMVSNMDDIGIARTRLINNNVPIVNGPGRHLPSGSIFLYFLDPDGLTLEYSFGMEEFPEEKPRKAKILERSPITLDLWGGKPLPGYASKGVIEGADETVKI